MRSILENHKKSEGEKPEVIWHFKLLRHIFLNNERRNFSDFADMDNIGNFGKEADYGK